MSNLVTNTSSGLVSLYEDLVKEKSPKGSKKLSLAQSQALQMLFDLKFITVIMSGRTEETKVKGTVLSFSLFLMKKKIDLR